LSILQTNPYNEWFYKSYNNYTVDTNTVRLMQSRLTGKTIEVFLGSWCGDSKREVPRLIKILQAANFDTANLKLVFVDYARSAYKQSPQHEEAGKTIHHVPTIIAYNKDREMGRIIESPVISLEKDLLAIVLNEAYPPNYRDVAWWLKNVKDKAKPLTSERLTGLAATLKPVCEGMRDINAYGFVLLAQKNYTEALNVFRLNTVLFPNVAATYNSLADAYHTAANDEEAKKNYEKVIQLKPGDENAVKMLAELK
jgi:tetratricopeptide (TPR) repeat protein